MSIVRIWKICKELSHTNWIIWDRGDEMWELRGDVLRHFEVLERCHSIDNVITERLRLLRESAIPLEAIRHSIQGWKVDESVVHSLPQVKLVLPLTSSPLSTPTPSPRTNDLRAGAQLAGQSDGSDKKGAFLRKNLLNSGSKPGANEAKEAKEANEANEAKEANGKGIQLVASESLLEEKSRPVTPLQSAQETQEEEFSQLFYNHPTEHWSSLSQWIPPHALFQPSLHHQATLELSDTPAQTYPYQIDSSKNSRPAQGQRQHVRQAQQTRPYHPKPSSHEIEIPKRPLFI